METDAVVDPHGARGVRRCVPLGVDRVKDARDLIFGAGRGLGQNALATGDGIVLGPIRRRELIPALRACAVAGRDHLVALRTFFRGALAVALLGSINPDLIHGPVPQNVAAEVQDQAVGLARVQPETATDHLVVEPR